MNNKEAESDQGSVAFEYIILLGMAIPVLCFWMEIFEPSEGYTEIGLRLADFFKRILVGISLPIP